MISRLRNPAPFARTLLRLVEAGFFGWLFIQSLRYLMGMLYSRIASASLIEVLPPEALIPGTPGLVDLAEVSSEITTLGLVAALPLIALLLGRARWLFIVAALLMGAGRIWMSTPGPVSTTLAAQCVVAGGLLYLALLVRQRAQSLPYFILLGLAIDQTVRAVGNSVDFTWSSAFAETLIPLVIAGIGIAILNAFFRPADVTSEVDPDRGVLGLWGGLGIGALLFVQTSLLGLPNAVAARADGDYTTLVPLILLATLLPIVPWVRGWARSLIGPFDSGIRGWIWFVFIALLIVLGTRLQRISIPGAGSLPIGSFALVVSQWMACMVWWWFVRPQANRELQFSALWVLLSGLTFTFFSVVDLFTFDYGFVRDFAPPLDFLNNVIPPLLRGFRGMGLGIVLIALLIALIPMVQSTRRIPWASAPRRVSVLAGMLVVALTVISAQAARPPLVSPLVNVQEMRIGTYNIHAGYSEFFGYDLEGIARAIQQSGVSVVMLQEVEAGRWTSFGVDQSLWLARRLGMDRRYYPTVEGLQGLAVLSRAPIAFADGVPIDGVDRATGLQRVQVVPGERAITLYNTMLGLLLEGANLEEQERNQRQQLEQILRVIDGHVRTDYGGRPENVLMVLGGTFHNIPDSPLLQTLNRTGFSDPFAGANPDLTWTLIRTDRRARIDYLWIWRQGLRWTGNGVILENAASDHRLAFVNLVFGIP